MIFFQLSPRLTAQSSGSKEFSADAILTDSSNRITSFQGVRGFGVFQFGHEGIKICFRASDLGVRLDLDRKRIWAYVHLQITRRGHLEPCIWDCSLLRV